MPILRKGRDNVAQLLVSAGSTTGVTKRYDSTGAVLWVSSSTDAHSGASTWFGAAGGVASTMRSGFPSIATNVLQFEGQYSTAQANFEWFSFIIHNATQSDSGHPLNYALTCMGTKVSTQIWTITTCVTITT